MRPLAGRPTCGTRRGRGWLDRVVPVSAAPTREEHAERSSATFDALQRAFYDGRTGLYRKARRFLLRRPFEVLWPFANAWASTCSLAALANGTVEGPAVDSSNASGLLDSRIQAALRYASWRDRQPASAAPLGLGSTVYRPLWSPLARRLWRVGAAYHDDNEWIALALLHQHRVTDDPRCVETARRIFAFTVGGWCDIPEWSHPGGIRWAEAAWSVGRNTCSNGPAAEVGAELFLITSERWFLDWAGRIYDWARGALLGEDGLYADQIRPDGRVEAAIWSYNQGSMIGAGVLLHEATGDREYLDQAERTAAASLAHYADVDRLAGELPIFVAVYLRSLLLLDALRPNARYRAVAESYATAMWERRRDPVSGLFLPESSGVNGTAPLVAVEAMLAGSQPRP